MIQRSFGKDSSCPICEHSKAVFWMNGVDRFNAAQETHRLVRCPDCLYVWLEDPPSPVEMGRHYGPSYDRFIARAGDNSIDRWSDRRQALQKYKSSGRLLDLGCSSGAFLQTLKGQQWELFGIEMSKAAGEQAAARSGAEVFVGDILDAPFPAASFDVITCFDVLEHVYEPRKVLQKVRQWLKPGGIFYALVPNIECGEARLFKSYWYGLELPRHLSHFSPTSLKHLADAVGLNIASLETHRNSALENSLHYVGDTILSRVGISRQSLAEAKPPGVPWKIMRKLMRWTIFYALYHAESVLGPGESIHAVFQAPVSREHTN